MIILLALAAAVPETAHGGARPASAAAVAASATATIRILGPATASAKHWSERGEGQKREILVREADGRVTRLRLIEHE